MVDRTKWLPLVCCALLATPSLRGDTTDAGPALGVARISLVNDDIAVRRGDSGDSVAATVNMAVVEGDAIRSTGASRAEVQLDQGNIVRIGGDTQIELLELASKQFRASLAGGVAIYSELADSEADVDIETPLAAVRPMQPGRYRVTVGANLTRIDIREGEAEIAFQSSTTRLKRGQSMTIRAAEDGEVAFETGKARSTDSLDRWAADRDKALRRATSRRYISRDIYGAEDLDRHGDWRWVTSLGFCWFPRVTRAWVPYRFGRWIWLDYYGWTWHGHEPWGWAPYHWGRWQYHAAHGWGWFPGAPQLRHVWRPALVTFVGFNPAGRLGPRSGFAGIGWVPLAPGERYSPWYGRNYYGRSHAGTIVVDNGSRFFDSHRNARDRRAVSYVDSRQFSMGSTHTPRALRTGQSHSVTTIRGRVPVVPSRSSQGRVVAASTSVRSRTAAGGTTRQSTSRLRDGSARIPFEERRRGLQSSVEAFYRDQRSGTSTVASRSTSPAGRPSSRAATGSTPRTLRTGGSGTRPAPATSPSRPSVTRTATARTRDAPSSSSSVRVQPAPASARNPASAGIRIGSGRAATPSTGTRGTTRTPTSRAGTGQVSALPSIRRGTASSSSTRAPAGSRPAAGHVTRESPRVPQLRRAGTATTTSRSRTGHPAATPRVGTASSSRVRTTPSDSRTGAPSRTRRPATVFAPRTATRIGSTGAGGSLGARSPAGIGTRPSTSAGTTARTPSTRPSASSRSGTAASTRRTPTSVSSRRSTGQSRTPTVFAPRTSSRSQPGAGSGGTASTGRTGPTTSRTSSSRSSTSRIGTRTSRQPSSATRGTRGSAGGSTIGTSGSRSRSSSGVFAPRTQSRSATRSSGSMPSSRTIGSPSSSSGTRSRIGTRTSSPSSTAGSSRRIGSSSSIGSRSTGSGVRSSDRGSFGTSRGSSSSRGGSLSTSPSRSGTSSSRPSIGSSRPSYSRPGSSASRPSSTSGSRTPSSRGSRSSSSSVRNGRR